MDALKACDDDPDVVCAVARLFLNDRKLDKARAWFNRAATLRPEDGDMWVRYYAFEKSLEDDAENNLNAVSKKTKKAKTDDSASSSPKEDVLVRASKADPNRGRYWAPIRKISKIGGIRLRKPFPKRWPRWKAKASFRVRETLLISFVNFCHAMFVDRILFPT